MHLDPRPRIWTLHVNFDPARAFGSPAHLDHPPRIWTLHVHLDPTPCIWTLHAYLESPRTFGSHPTNLDPSPKHLVFGNIRFGLYGSRFVQFRIRVPFGFRNVRFRGSVSQHARSGTSPSSFFRHCSVPFGFGFIRCRFESPIQPYSALKMRPIQKQKKDATKKKKTSKQQIPETVFP